jgi:phytoene synthase
MSASPDILVLDGAASSFHYSFSFLPRPQRKALETVYAFCRATDDLVDNEDAVQSNMERLSKWRLELEHSLEGASSYQLLNQLNTIANRFNIPIVHFYELLRGVEMDLLKSRYATFDELLEYCRLVASSVGLMCLGIFGSSDERTKEYAVQLGIALQLTNILRDVGIDAAYGRIYLPLEDLAKFSCSEEDILQRRYSDRFRELMAFQADRAELYFRRAQAALPAQERKAMFAAKIMERIYYHMLVRIKRADYNVFDHKVRMPKLLQFLIAVKYWTKDRLLGA